MVYAVPSLPDDNTCVQNINLLNSMSDSKPTKSIQVLKLKDSTFDSGILSEADNSPNLSTEIESASNFPLDYENRVHLTFKSSQFEHQRSCMCEEQSVGMGLSTTDSGIFTDVSDQLSEHKINDDTKEVPKFVSRSVSDNKIKLADILEHIFERNEDGDTKLHLSILDKNENMVKRILQLIPSSHLLDIRNYYCQTSLHLAILMGLPQITRLLYLAGARTDIEDGNGDTALHLACKMNNLACVTAILRPLKVFELKSVKFSYKPIPDNPVLYLNEYNYDGLSCLHIAAAYENYTIMNQLLTNGADVNIGECKGGYTVLHEAVKNNQEDLVKYILQHPGTDVCKRTYARRSAYELSSGNYRIRHLLLEKGCESYDFESSSESDGSDDDSFLEEYIR